MVYRIGNLYTSDGDMTAEFSANSNFLSIVHQYSCVISGAIPTPIAGDTRGWACFDVATRSTIGIALSTGHPSFGQQCANGQVYGDGVITIEDVLVVLFTEYGVAPYNIPLNTPTITDIQPQWAYAQHCSEQRMVSMTCLTDQSRRLQKSNITYPLLSFEAVKETPHGMWVQLAMALYTGTMYIIGISQEAGTSAVGFGSSTLNNVSVPGDVAVQEMHPTAVVFDAQGFELQATWGLPGQIQIAPTLNINIGDDPHTILYVWTQGDSVCIYSNLQNASYLNGIEITDTCVTRSTPFPPSLPPPSSPKPPPPRPSPLSPVKPHFPSFLYNILQVFAIVVFTFCLFIFISKYVCSIRVRLVDDDDDEVSEAQEV